MSDVAAQRFESMRAAEVKQGDPFGKVRPELPEVAKKRYLFVVGTNNSGTSAIRNTILHHDHVCGFVHEGHCLVRYAKPPIRFPIPANLGCVRVFTERLDAFLDESNYDWEAVRDLWLAMWESKGKYRQARYLVEKSPPSVVWARFAQKVFEPSFFVLVVRDPYATCASIRKYMPEKPMGQIVDHWLRCTELQLENLKLLPNSVILRYEDFCCGDLGLVSELLGLSLSTDGVRVRSVPIQNMNARQVSALLGGELNVIRDRLAPRRELIDRFGYRVDCEVA